MFEELARIKRRINLRHEQSLSILLSLLSFPPWHLLLNFLMILLALIPSRAKGRHATFNLVYFYLHFVIDHAWLLLLLKCVEVLLEMHLVFLLLIAFLGVSRTTGVGSALTG